MGPYHHRLAISPLWVLVAFLFLLVCHPSAHDGLTLPPPPAESSSSRPIDLIAQLPQNDCGQAKLAITNACFAYMTWPTSELLEVCVASGDAVSAYAEAYASHVAGDESIFRKKTESILRQRSLERCVGCEILAYRDLGLSYAMREPVDYDASERNFVLGCSLELRSSGTLMQLGSCMLLDTAKENQRQLKREYYRRAQTCLASGRATVMGVDWISR